jgi:tRNA(Arg) A34 adenosine deaminase TadA
VGCVLVHNGRVIARGMNATNKSRNGTRHAELMAICALLSYSPKSDSEAETPQVRSEFQGKQLRDVTNGPPPEIPEAAWDDVDPTLGHLFPYGQKLHPSPRVDKAIITESTLYVTVEPCVMCASLLRQLKIKKVFFGAVNDKFGGTGGVFRIHQNAPTCREDSTELVSQNGSGSTPAKASTSSRSTGATGISAEGDAGSSENTKEPESTIPGAVDRGTALLGDGGNVERGYEVEGGWGRDEAVTLLRQFYVQENGRGK